MSWLLYPADQAGDFHVTPHCDLRPHLLAMCCWCRPERDSEEPSVVMHNALDQRERYESGEIKLQ